MEKLKTDLEKQHQSTLNNLQILSHNINEVNTTALENSEFNKNDLDAKVDSLKLYMDTKHQISLDSIKLNKDNIDEKINVLENNFARVENA